MCTSCLQQAAACYILRRRRRHMAQHPLLGSQHSRAQSQLWGPWRHSMETWQNLLTCSGGIRCLWSCRITYLIVSRCQRQCASVYSNGSSAIRISSTMRCDPTSLQRIFDGALEHCFHGPLSLLVFRRASISGTTILVVVPEPKLLAQRAPLHATADELKHSDCLKFDTVRHRLC